MQSASLCFNLPLFRKNVRRFWPLFTLYSVLLFVLLPMALLLMSVWSGVDVGAGELTRNFNSYLVGLSTYGAIWIQAGYGLLLAMALWSYLYNNRSVSLLHALPISRSTHFLTNYLTGLIFVILPSIAATLLGFAAQAIAGAVTPKPLLIWLLCNVLASVFFFSFATFFAHITGHLLMLPTLYIIFNGFAFGLVMLLDTVFSYFVYGFAPMSILWLTQLGRWTSPLVALMLNVQPNHEYVSEGILTPVQVQGLDTLAIFALVGLLFAAAALICYRRRRLELAGEVITVPFLRPIAKYSFALSLGLAMGTLFTALFGSFSGIGLLILFVALWAVIGYYAAEMLLRKSYRVFKKGARGALCLVLVIAALFLALETDIFGYEKSLPTADQIESISITGQENLTFTQPEELGTVRDFHALLIQEKARLENENRQGQRTGYYSTTAAMQVTSLGLNYTLKDGTTLTRSYLVPLQQADLTKPESLTARYEALMSSPAALTESLLPASVGPQYLEQIELPVYNLDQQSLQLPESGEYYLEPDPDRKSGILFLRGAAAEKLYAAARADILAGRLGRVPSFSWNRTEQTQINYNNAIYIRFLKPYNIEEAEDLSSSPWPWYRQRRADGTGFEYRFDSNIELVATASDTLAYLKTLGITPSVHFLTQDSKDYDPSPYGGDEEAATFEEPYATPVPMPDPGTQEVLID